MKFIHASDIHLDSPLRGLYQDESAPDIDDIRGSTRKALENLISLVLSEKAPLLIIAGDLYDGDWQDFSTGLFFANQMQRLAEAGVRVAVVRGNHDAANKMTRTLVLPGNVKIFNSRKPETWIVHDLGVALHGQSYASREITDNLAVDYPDPVPGMLNVGILHCLISGAEGHVSYAPCTTDQLVAKGYDYWALGHVHEYKVIKEEPPIIYSGCCQGRHIRESGKKGCVLVTLENEELNTEFIPLDVLRWIRVEIDVTGFKKIDQIFQAFENILQEKNTALDGRICCARVVLTGRSTLHGRLMAEPEALEANIKAMAIQISNQSTWIEKIELKTRPQLNIEALSKSDTPQGELLRYMETLSSGTDMYNDLEIDLTPLKSKLSGSGVYIPENDMQNILKSARDMILTLLGDLETTGTES